MLDKAEPIFDYKVVSDGDQTEPEWEETVWVYVNETKHGPQLGTVHIRQEDSDEPGKPTFTATFSLTGFDPVEVIGSVPGGNWSGIGEGNAKGAGRRRDKKIKIECWNPKGWG